MAVSRFNPDYPDAGLVLLNKTDYTGASTVSVDNVFSATYSNYKIIGSLKGSTTATINMRLRASGTDLTSSSYIAGKLYVGAGASLAFGSENNIAGDTMTLTRAGTADTDAGFVMDLLSPFETGRKQALSIGSGQWVYWLAYHIQSASSYDGFTIYPASGTITGTVRIYGYKNEV